MIRLPIRRCPNCGYIGPTRKFADGDDEGTNGGPRYACPRCGHEVAAPDPRLA